MKIIYIYRIMSKYFLLLTERLFLASFYQVRRISIGNI